MNSDHRRKPKHATRQYTSLAIVIPPSCLNSFECLASFNHDLQPSLDIPTNLILISLPPIELNAGCSLAMQRHSAPGHLRNPFLCHCRSCLRLRLRHFRQRNHSRHRLAGSWCCRCPKTEAAGRRPSRLTLEPGRRRLLLPADGISAWRSKCKSAVEGSILGLRAWVASASVCVC